MSLPLTVVPAPAHAPALLLRLYRPQQHRGLPSFSTMLLLLDHEEQRRADRMEDPRTREVFVVGRYLQRCFVAETLGVDACTLVAAHSCPSCAGRGLTDADHGRPGYTLHGEPVPLRLSLSRSRGAVLLAALPSDTELRIGVDLESVDAVAFHGFDDVALTSGEREFVRRLRESDRPVCRARLWARKEALVKALGTGFGREDPGDLDVLEEPRISDAELPISADHELSSVGLDAEPHTDDMVAAVALVPVDT